MADTQRGTYKPSITDRAHFSGMGVMQRAQIDRMRQRQAQWRRDFDADRADQLLAEFHGEIPTTSHR